AHGHIISSFGFHQKAFDPSASAYRHPGRPSMASLPPPSRSSHPVAAEARLRRCRSQESAGLVSNLGRVELSHAPEPPSHPHHFERKEPDMSARPSPGAGRFSIRWGCFILFTALLLGGALKPGAAQVPAPVSFLPPITYDRPIAVPLKGADGVPLLTAD